MRKGWGLFLLLSACATLEPGYAHFDDVEYPFATRQIRGRRAQLDLAIAELGSGPGVPVVLIHPWALSMKVWGDVAPSLAQGRRVLLLDLPGHGKSEKLTGAYPLERFGSAVLDAMDQSGISEAVLVGNSLGGATALTTALMAPERVRGLVLLGAPGGRKLPEPIRRGVRQFATARELHSLSELGWAAGFWAVGGSKTPLGLSISQDLRRLTRSYEHEAWSRAAFRAFRSVAEWAPDLRTIQVPAVVVHGRWDLSVSRASSEAMAEQLPAGTLVELPDCGHLLEIECPEETLLEVGQLLAQVEGGPRLGAPPAP